MAADVALRAEGIGKEYLLGEGTVGYTTLREAMMRAVPRLRRGKEAPKTQRVWALRDISFEIMEGEAVGIIGRNGAGKSTLLKILSRITEPTTGYADIHGRVGSLLEVGTGFHPELTGRENIFLNGAILGMRRSEIEARMDDIVEFSEVAQFLDTPVKRYSSGMYLRLAFSVAAHLQPDILLVDEVLAVGDAAFQNKCLGKMSEVTESGRTVLFVSHNMAAVRKFCERAVLLERGRVTMIGPTEDVVEAYLAESYDGPMADLLEITNRRGEGDIRIKGVRLEDGRGQAVAFLTAGEQGRVVLATKAARPHQNVEVALTFRDSLDQRIMYLDSRYTGGTVQLPAHGDLVCDIPRVSLAPGQYRLELRVISGGHVQDWLNDAGSVEVVDGGFFRSGVPLRTGFQVALMDFAWGSREHVAVPAVAGDVAEVG